MTLFDDNHHRKRPFIRPFTPGRPHRLRKPCKRCGSENGRLNPVNGQDTVRCADCGRFQYNAPKTETERAPRRVSSRPNISPSQRARIFMRDGNKCTRCGKGVGDVATITLHVAHLISVEDDTKYGVPAEVLHSEDNLATQCEECNLGYTGTEITLILHTLRIRHLQRAAAAKPETREQLQERQ